MIYIGTSGWQYRHWRNTFYPQGVPQKNWLEFFCERFRTVELNNSFYRLPPPENFTAWAARTPDDFIIAVKMSRYLTHIKRLKEPEEPVDRFLRHARHLGPKMGPILLQFPPDLQIRLDDLAHTLDLIPKDLRVTVEFRHESWWVDEVRDMLEEKCVNLCLADRHSKPITALWKTADWGYVRFHEGTGRPHPCYPRRVMTEWAQRIADLWGPDADVYAYFNNDPRACAIRDARVFAAECTKVGLSPTRVPGAREVTVGDDESAAWATA